MGAVIQILVLGAVVQLLARAGRRYGYRVSTPIVLAVWVLATVVFIWAWRSAAYSVGELDRGWTASFIIGAPAVAFFTTLMWHDARRRPASRPPQTMASGALSVPRRSGLVLLTLFFGLIAWLGTLSKPIAWTSVLSLSGAAAICLWSAAVGRMPAWLLVFLQRDIGGTKNL